MNYLFEARFIDSDEIIRGDLLHAEGRTYIVIEAATESYSEEETDLFATVFYEVDPESVKLVESEE